MSVPDTVRHASAMVIFEEYPVMGYNYRMTDVQAAIGREQLKRLPEIVARRRTLADRYSASFRAMPDTTPPAEPHWAQSNWQSYPVRLNVSIDQLAVMTRMLEQGVATRRGIMCAHLEPAYADAEQRHDLSRSRAARNHVILLPLFPQMTADEQDRVVAALGDALDVSAARRRPLADAILA